LIGFVKYLESVCEENKDSYTDVSEILTRYRILREANEKLKRRTEKLRKSHEEIQMQLHERLKHSKNNILALQSNFASTLSTYESVHGERQSREQDMRQAQIRDLDQQRVLSIVSMSVRNIFNRARHQQVTQPQQQPQQQVGSTNAPMISSPIPSTLSSTNTTSSINSHMLASKDEQQQIAQRDLAELLGMLDEIAERLIDFNDVVKMAS